MFKKELWIATFTFIGLIIGAGIFAIPYVVAQAGFIIGLIDLAILTLIVAYVSLCLGEVVLRTKENHQLAGLAEKYLGKEGKLIMFASILISLYGALIAYSIGAGSALEALTNINPLYMSLIFLLVVSLVIFFKLGVFEAFESFFSPLKLLIVIILILLAMPFVKFNNLGVFNPSLFYLPYGVLLFALTGFIVIPDMAQELHDKKLLKKSIMLGIIISAVVYLFFAFAVVGVLGEKTTELSTIALGELIGTHMLLLGNIFAVLAMGTAFVAIGFSLKDSFILDYNINPTIAWLGVVIIPVMFTLIGQFNFVKIIEVSGIIGTGISLLCILVMHTRAIKQGNREPEYKIKNILIVKGIIILLIIMAIVYEFFRILGK